MVEDARIAALRAEYLARGEVDLDCQHIWDYPAGWNYNEPETQDGQNGYRRCKVCDYREWKLACWTGCRWSSHVPPDVFSARPDLDPAALTSAANVAKNHEFRVRSLDLVPMHVVNTNIELIGAGSIGSFTALALCKMGFDTINIWDEDKINTVNVGVQLYGKAWTLGGGGNIGSQKANVLCHLLREQVPGNGSFTPNNHYTGGTLHGLVISAVDSMAARKMIWEGVKASADCQWFIDARMAAEFAVQYTINPLNPADCAMYERTLYTDEEAVQERCTARSTVYTALMIAGMISKTVRDVLAGHKYTRTVQWDIKNNDLQATMRTA